MRNYQNSGKSSYSNRNNRGHHSESQGERGNRNDGYKRNNRRVGSSDRRPGHPSSYSRHGNRPSVPYRVENKNNSFNPKSSWMELSGRTIEEVLEDAVHRFNVQREDFKTEVIDEGSKGFLGIGSKPAKVKIALKSHVVPVFAEGVLTRILRGMGLPDTVKIQKDSDGNIVLNIQGPSSGTLIGRHGHTLESLQYLVLKVVQRITGEERAVVIVDVENYLERQKDKLKELALGLAQKAKETGAEVPMRPMSSKDRRVVHLALKDHEHVTTESRGEDIRRKVVIIPKIKSMNVTNVLVDDHGENGLENAVVDAEASSTRLSDESSATGAIELGNRVPIENLDMDDNIGNR